MKSPSPSHDGSAYAYCRTPRRVTKRELVNMLHQASCQFNAITRYETMTLVDNRATMEGINRIMSRCGHIGFTPSR